MGPIARAMWKTLNRKGQGLLESAMHVHLDQDFIRRVFDLANAFPATEYDGYMPHNYVFLEGFFGEDNGETPIGLIVQRSMGELPEAGITEETIGVSVIIPENPDGKRSQFMCGYQPRKKELVFMDKFLKGQDRETFEKSEEFQRCQEIINAIDLLFTLMAEPRFIRRDNFSPLKRNMAARATGKKALRNTWIKLGWTIGAETRPKGNVPGSAPRKAFHMVRAHWRHYDHQTKMGQQRDGREGWWVWIEAHYSGNPALGEIKHHYMPKLDSQKSARTVVDVLTGRAFRALA